MNFRKLATVSAVPAALLVSGLLVTTTSHAAFQATTQTGASTLTTARVALTNDHAATAVFNAAAVIPGDTGSQDVVVTYTGDATVDVHLYANSSTIAPELADQLQLVVSDASGTVFAGSVGEFAADDTFAEGHGSWKPVGAATRTYTITWSLPSTGTDAGDNALQGKTAALTFGWEARSTH